jgi:hypothetical protein
MSLLTPWFLLGLALIGGPIVAHLIRRATRERVSFSALRFLDESPPTLDRKSRIQNPWLLALRCLIVAVLAFGFARPFFRSETPVLNTPSPARHVVAVLDESASMRRAGLWNAAREKLLSLTATLKPADQLVLLAAGDRVSELIGSAQWLATPVGDRAGLVRATLDARQPGWGPTPLDSAAEAALARWEDMSEAKDTPAKRELVLISDFAAGAHVSGLSNLAWPEHTEVILEPVSPTVPGNASLHWLGWTDPAAPTVAARVRVSRSFDAPEAYQLQWHDARTGDALGEPESFTLLPGASEVRLIPLPENPPAGLRLDLAGDTQDFDNRLWLVRAAPKELTLTYLGADAANDPQHARFYIEKAVGGWREPRTRVATELPALDAPPGVIVVTAALNESQLADVRSRIEGGAFALVLLGNDQLAATAAALVGETGWSARTPERGDAMFGQLDFQHPLFAAFADPLYSDFTRIRFWQPHSITLPPNSKASVIARFDDASPAVVEAPLGRGRVIVWGGDWSPVASQWVLSSKFVPWLQALAERAAGGTGRPAIAEIGDAARLLEGASAATWRRLDRGSTTAPASSTPTEPGLYELTENGRKHDVALLVPMVESQTQTLPLDTWEQLGVPLRSTSRNGRISVSAASMQPTTNAVMLENRQQLWRWLLWVALALLALESVVSFAVSRRRPTLTPTPA